MKLLTISFRAPQLHQVPSTLGCQQGHMRLSVLEKEQETMLISAV